DEMTAKYTKEKENITSIFPFHLQVILIQEFQSTLQVLVKLLRQ
ncbi:hypothetical protein Q604_UNBC10362G0001, partial [human gut metagenome]